MALANWISRHPNLTAALLINIVVLTIVSLASLAGCGAEDGPMNDRQRCENESSSNSWRFDDCKKLFPGQTGLSGWD
ncbi:hypothetical protein ACGFYQ_27490 [Streptomyces sp. NPDC048258]|uniref:hypothetical protein n=1 Tax=Streptomyces sp. NPDC048258 TaxID=3365527 RepID=UPI0037158A10